MKKTVIYRYLGTNGILETPIHLEDVYFVRLYDLSADKGNILTDGTVYTHAVRVSEEDLDSWTEVKDKGQN